MACEVFYFLIKVNHIFSQERRYDTIYFAKPILNHDGTDLIIIRHLLDGALFQKAESKQRLDIHKISYCQTDALHKNTGRNQPNKILLIMKQMIDCCSIHGHNQCHHLRKNFVGE